MRAPVHLAALVLLCLVAITPTGTALGADAPDPGLPGIGDCATGFKGLWNDGLHIYSCSGDRILLRPMVEIGGQWLTPRSSDCTTLGQLLTCTIDQIGTLYLSTAGGVQLHFTPSKPVTVHGLGLRGPLHLKGAVGWLSHGFQSWSQTGVISIRKPPSAADLRQAVLQSGEDEVYRRGREVAWWYTFVGGGETTFLAGASTAETFKSWLQIAKTANAGVLQAQLVSGDAGEAVALVAGQSLAGETWHIALGNSLQTAMDHYSASLGSRRRSRLLTPLYGWNSWYGLWGGVSEAAVLANTEELSKTLLDVAPSRARPAYVVIDDGWEKAWGDWEPNEKFPSSLGALTQSIKAHGLAAGIWIAPVMVSLKSPLAQVHPDWLVQDLSYQHPTGTFKVLDVTHPDAAAFLQERIRKLVDSGFSLIKIDFLFAAALEGRHFKPATGMQAYRKMLQLIRAAAGEETILVGVGAPPLGTLPFVDSWRVGGDIAFSPGPMGIPAPQFRFIANQARSIAGRYPFCRATLCDGDPLLMRAPLSRGDVELGSWVVGLTGGGLFLSDPLPALPSERRSWGLAPTTIAASLSGLAAAPASFFPEQIPDELVNVRDFIYPSEHQVPNLWRLPGGEHLGLNFLKDERLIRGVLLPGRSARVLPEAVPR